MGLEGGGEEEKELAVKCGVKEATSKRNYFMITFFHFLPLGS